jgi:ABC-2 type transport system permease protein
MNLDAQQEIVESVATVTPHNVLLFNPQGDQAAFMLPALLAFILGEAYGQSSMRALVNERAGGQLERLLMTPMSYVGMIVGKLVPWFVISIINVCLFLLVIRWGFHVPMRGNVGLLIAACALYSATILLLGSWVAAGAPNIAAANNRLVMISFPGVFLSGYIFPLYSLPKWLLPVSYALPHTHFIEVMRGVCLRGASATELWVDLAYLIVMPVVLSVLASVRFYRSILQ